MCVCEHISKKAIFLIGEQFISGLSDREARKLKESSARSANARATPGWPAGNEIYSNPVSACMHTVRGVFVLVETCITVLVVKAGTVESTKDHFEIDVLQRLLLCSLRFLVHVQWSHILERRLPCGHCRHRRHTTIAC